jgi:hypothetical protein
MTTNIAIKITHPCHEMLPPNAPAALVTMQAMPRPNTFAMEK